MIDYAISQAGQRMLDRYGIVNVRDTRAVVGLETDGEVYISCSHWGLVPCGLHGKWRS